MKTKLTLLFLILIIPAACLRGEIIVYEHKFPDLKIDTPSEREMNAINTDQINKISESSKILTIRIEKGESLNINSKKIIKGTRDGNYNRSYDSMGKFLINVKYDNFEKKETIQLYHTFDSNPRWYEQLSNSGYRYSSNYLPIEGPATISVNTTPYTHQYLRPGGKYTFHVPEQFFKISLNKTSTTQNTASNNGSVLVLPDGVNGLKLKLESSTDLVNWTEDSLGSKNSSDKKRFYRIRAVKE